MPRYDDFIGLRFDTVAERYHSVRPRYPDVLWNALFDSIALPPGARVLEIGAGTGVATAELVQRGCRVTALEPGTAMAAMIERDLGHTGLVEVVVSQFGEWEAPDEPFDLVVGATSLHWIERSLLEERLHSLVRPGGYAALLHYLHVTGGDTAFFDAAQLCYATHDPDYQAYHLRTPGDRSGDVRMLDALPGFTPVISKDWLVDIPSDRDHYVSLVSTYATTLSIPEPHQSELLRCIGDLIDSQFDGHITKLYRFDLVVTQRNR